MFTSCDFRSCDTTPELLRGKEEKDGQEGCAFAKLPRAWSAGLDGPALFVL